MVHGLLPRRRALHEVIVALLCALSVLGGILDARARAGRLADPQAAFMLCLAGAHDEGTGQDGQRPQHACADCCMPSPVATPPRLAVLTHPATPGEAIDIIAARPEPAATYRTLPWSRGPPKVA